MCGLVGCISFSDRFRVTAPYIERMRDTMAHRGPDGAGTWISKDGAVGFGHRRLSIIDLSTAALQPMGSDDGTVQLIFNGEIYNHAEIRRELEALGHRFRTDHSDTEALLRAYMQWGRECVHRFRGMFAFVIWDGRSRELWLVRDRVGIKPLYYSRHNGRLTFASEIKALLADPDQARTVDEESMFFYFSFLVPPAPRTMFKGIEKLASGTWLLVQADGSTRSERYWDALDAQQDLGRISDGEISERVLETLTEAVRLRMVSDVPVGVFLSGGIDSSTNAALFSRCSTGPVRTFSIGYDQDYGTYANEFAHARRVADDLHTEHHEVRLKQQDLIDFLPKMVALQDEPIGDPVCVPLYYVSKLARDNGVTVCQLGEGADELFWGYPNWKRALAMQNLSTRWPVPIALRRAGLWGLRQLNRHESLPYDWLSRSTEGQPIFWGGAESFPQLRRERLLSPRLRQEFDGRTSWDAIAPIWDRFRAHGQTSYLHWMTYLDLNYRLPELLLMRVDKMSMGVSLEGRVPFLDHRLVELALSIDESVLTRGNVLKAVLKRAVRGVIPDEIIDRPKQGFGVPVHEWMTSQLGDYTRDTVGRFARETDFLDEGATDGLMASNHSPDKWRLLNLALWWQECIA
jgi:asparagine synthase (glutamine-hydrolysing)